LCDKYKNRFQETIGHQQYGLLLSYRGEWEKSEQELTISRKYWEKSNTILGVCIDEAYRALRFLLMTREEAISDTRKSNNEYRRSAIVSATRALELADEDTRQRYPHPADYIHAYWLLGAAYRANNELTLAEENLSKALNLCRQINSVDSEADIILDLARLRYDQKNYGEAKSFADEALLMTVRCGYVLQGADVNLFLAQYALEQEKNEEKAKAYAEEALKLAACDGPPYYYKVAYDEAERFLENLK
jgi:tetratricopeptide (TPR) repeat protein